MRHTLCVPGCQAGFVLYTHTYLVIQNAARQAQHSICALAHGAAVPMGAANAEGYAGLAIIPGLSWAGTNALSDPLFVIQPMQHPDEGSEPARSAIRQVFERVELDRIHHTKG